MLVDEEGEDLVMMGLSRKAGKKIPLDPKSSIQ
ncbi:hypothetical protein SAMN06265368_0191 [Cohaesibacter gelatinilyticus]|uniref:Uncharacterized protein n=1 Tax=Cohaesibacter gelatinilyticus TaxID=372072 RepID=A0A285N8V0_9HYPH|nr:hypothetical protein SAMN06265368_0191 [Cohaesibacter gelatinilyticus]